MSNTLTSATDLLLNNPLGRLALGSVQLYMSTVHSCIDYVLPPVSDDEADAGKPSFFPSTHSKMHTDVALCVDLKSAAAPVEPSQKIIWFFGRGFDAISKIQHRVIFRSQKALHALGMKGLLFLGAFIDFVEWVSFICITLPAMSCITCSFIYCVA